MKSNKIVAMAIVGLMAILAFLPMISSAQEAGAVANVGTATSIVTVPAYNNPVLTTKCSEPSMIYNTTTGWIDEWFTSGSTYGGTGFNNLWYTHTTNANYTTHITPVRVMQNIRFPYVVQYSGIFYCFAHNNSAPVGNLYMWTSHDRLNWTLANGGKAVLYHSATTSSFRYWMANPSVFLLNGMWYLWTECGNSSASGTYWNYFGIAYSYSAFSSSLNFTTNMTAIQVIPGGCGNQYIEYVPDRSTILMIYYQMTSATLAQETTITAPIGSNLALASSYTKWTGFVVGIITEVTADWTWAITPTGLVFQFFHDQPATEDIYQGSIALTLDQFYDDLTGYTVASYPSSVSGLVSLVFLMFTMGVVIAPIMWTSKIAKEKHKFPTIREVMDMFIFIIVGCVCIGIVWSMA